MQLEPQGARKVASGTQQEVIQYKGPASYDCSRSHDSRRYPRWQTRSVWPIPYHPTSKMVKSQIQKASNPVNFGVLLSEGGSGPLKQDHWVTACRCNKGREISQNHY